MPIPSLADWRKRSLLMIFPLLVLPFVVLLFYVLGGGRDNPVADSKKERGLNLQLPDAHFVKKKEKDKLGLYEIASQDSVKRQEALKKDPNLKMDAGLLDSMSFSHSQAFQDILDKSPWELSGKPGGTTGPSQTGSGIANRDREIAEKLSRLKAIVQGRPVDSLSIPEMRKTNFIQPAKSIPSGQSKEQNQNRSTDPELSQLDRMLDKVMAIQHPEITKDSLLKATETKQTIYRMEIDGAEQAVMAVIPEQQTLVSGATIRLQLNESVTIAGITLPADQWIYGTAMLAQERLRIQVRSVRSGHHILPVSLEVYDLDGIEGIYIPGSISREVSKQSLDQSLSGLTLETLDPSIGAQAASAGIQAAKSLISRKVKQVQVTIPQDYLVFLKNIH